MVDAEQSIGKNGRGPGLCVVARREPAEVGAAILRRGGNAVDAVVAAGFMEAVIAPAMCGIGGYAGTGVAFLAKPGRLVAIDANAVAPAAATPGMFPVIPARDPNDFKLADTRNRQGPLSVSVPGVLAGLLTMLESWGRLDRKTVMAPAIRRAREGVSLTPDYARTWLTMEAHTKGRPAPDKAAGPVVVPMPELADTLETIADGGSEVFYDGPIGRAIADHVLKEGGILSRDDMARYRARTVEPVTVEVRGHLLGAPPPGSGGLSSLQMIALFDRLDREGRAGPAGSVAMYEALLEIAKVVWEDRLTTLGDPPAMSRAPQSLLSDDHLKALYQRVLAGLAEPGPGRLVAPDPLRGTSHLAAADAEGNVVSWTQTHGGGFGSHVMVPGTGVVLGHGMCRFEPRPGWPNSIAPGKRPLHNMCPAIALKDGRAVMAVGGAGGRTIVNNAAAVSIARLVLGLGPAEALAVPRIQCETIEPASIERAAGAATIAGLKARGHALKEVAADAGRVELIVRDGDAWAGAAEPRLATATVATSGGPG